MSLNQTIKYGKLKLASINIMLFKCFIIYVSHFWRQSYNIYVAHLTKTFMIIMLHIYTT